VSLSRIPLVDMAGIRDGDEAALQRAARAIHEACTQIGFFYIVNHGLSSATIDAAMSAARKFFALPEAVKRKVAVNQRHRGWHAMGGATMYQATRPDYKEFFGIGLELPEDDPDVLAGQDLRGPNQWPDEDCPELRVALSRYYEEVALVGHDLLRAVAVSLGLPRDFFVGRYVKRLQRTQVVYYPEHPADATEDLYGVAPHTDYGCITLLYQDDSGGLEARDIHGNWVPAPPIEGSLVINVGDLLERWSNDRFRSTMHRVINRSGHERFSIATFFDPDYNAMVDPADLGIAAHEAKYPPISAGDYIVKRINDSMAYRKQRARAVAG
jgi:isopenicillin N synthase-like dioxygenase